MKIGIVGFGFVGKALFNGFLDNAKVLKIDPKLDTSVKDLKKFNPEIIFICVPTPMNNGGDQDISILENVLEDLIKNNIKAPVVIKSTVHPGNITRIKEIIPSFVYNPEFLREKHANEDFINSTLIIFGGEKNHSNFVANVYSKYTKCLNKDYIFTDQVSASLIKYAINSFLATKVIFFNQFHDLFNALDANESWVNFTNYISKDSRIGDSHMMVPGHDERYGFGGACLPKDTSAITKFAHQHNVELSLIKHVIKSNNKIRASYKDLSDRENEQNITFSKEDS